MSDSSDNEVEDYENEYLDTDGEDEIMPSDEGDSDDEEDEILNNRFKIELKKDEMASDIEDADEDDYLPNAKAWGKNKSVFYDTDYVDKDFRSQKQKDEDLAQYEEEEALQIQKRLLESVNENDLGIDLLIGSKTKKPKADIKEDKESEMLKLDITTLSKSQKYSFIKQESPELELLISDFKKYLNELKNDLQPMLNGLLKQSNSLTSGLKYLKLRFLVLLNYCTNISFYLSLKSSQDKQFVKDHPIIKQLFMHKKLITQLDSCVDQNMKFVKEMECVMKKLSKNVKIKFIEDNEPEIEEMIVPKDFDEIVSDKSEDEEENSFDQLEEDEKRAITYEMEKNKGLTPKRKKEQRNPRLKYRKKFEKAVIRRKGQVREPRKEIKKYGGEITGINMRTVKSVKFK